MNFLVLPIVFFVAFALEAGIFGSEGFEDENENEDEDEAAEPLNR